MKKLFSIITLTLIFTLSFSQENAYVNQLDSVLTQLYNTDRFNGTVLYASKGKVLYKKAFGVTDIKTGESLQTSSSFNLASVSKQFIGMCILILSEEGKLTLDDNIKKYLPELPYVDITIRNLLTHTSGIPEYFDLYNNHRETLDTLNNEKLIQSYNTYSPRLEFLPGTSWSYCNTNYVFLATIIERITKQPLNIFFKNNIATPLGLNDTYVYHLLLPVVPTNHVYGFSEVNGVRKLNDLINVDGVTGDGNIYSSVEDLYKWEQSLKTEKLVKKETLQQAFEPVKLKDGSTYNYGFGWGIDKPNEQYSHTGGWAGFINVICRDIKNDRTLIVLSSGDNHLGAYTARNIFNGQRFTIPETFLITNVKVIDGTGSPARNVSVRIEEDKIMAVGDLKKFDGEKVIDGGGKILAPGFIDSHSHLEGSFKEHPDALAALSQGITTIVAGQDGDSYYINPMKGYFSPAINYATYTGHSTLRESVMGKDQLNRPATQKEINTMKDVLRLEMKNGSLGLSTGLEYESAFYSNRDEIIQLAKVAAEYNGKYISHLRSEDISMADAIDEIIEIGRQAKLPVQISHIKIALKDDWGTAPALIAKLESARAEGINITADCYPYTFWNSTVRVLFPKKDFTSIEGANFAVEHLFDPTGSVMVRFKPNKEYVGKTVSEIAKLRNETAAQTLLYLVAASEEYEKLHPEEDGIETIMGKSMSDADIIPFLSWAHTNICSDGANGGHPRGYGAFTRVLGYYVREQKIMSLENCINKMTALTAENVGIKERGIIAAGYYADLVLFDAATVIDKANIEDPKALSDGILMVWVNGKMVYRDKEFTNVFPGKFLSRTGEYDRVIAD
jgi:N-acyl-D-aspartate/D-glutamate deacylase